jgi:hypothetical protein
MPSIPITIETPCGPKTVKIPLPLELPPLPSLGDFPPPFPPKIPIPLPDCSAFEHTGSAPEPEEDSLP